LAGAQINASTLLIKNVNVLQTKFLIRMHYSYMQNNPGEGDFGMPEKPCDSQRYRESVVGEAM